MRVTVFSTKAFERESLGRVNRSAGHDLVFREERLTAGTAPLAAGSECACLFVGDSADRAAIRALRDAGVRLLALRSAGFNHVDLDAAAEMGMTVARVPAYSPHSVAEHAAALILALNRKTHRAFNRVREQNFSIEGLMGFDLCGKTVGVVGTGKIGEAFARIMLGFGCRVIAFDPAPSEACVLAGVKYVEIGALWRESDVIALHCPLTPQTRHLVNAGAFAAMKPGAMLINTSRGAVVDARAAIDALKSGRLGALGIDVYEEEDNLFFRDLSSEVIQDDTFVRLMTFPNVLITAHQGFFTREAVDGIAQTTLGNISAFEQGGVDPENLVGASHSAGAAAAPPPRTGGRTGGEPGRAG